MQYFPRQILGTLMERQLLVTWLVAIIFPLTCTVHETTSLPFRLCFSVGDANLQGEFGMLLATHG